MPQGLFTAAAQLPHVILGTLSPSQCYENHSFAWQSCEGRVRHKRCKWERAFSFASCRRWVPNRCRCREAVHFVQELLVRRGVHD